MATRSGSLHIISAIISLYGMTLIGHLLSLVYGLVSTFAVFVHAAGAFGLTTVTLLILACFFPH
jgi:uncharacterized membrane protein